MLKAIISAILSWRFPFYEWNQKGNHLVKGLPRLTSQRHSALISSDSEYFQVCLSAVHYLKISETALIQLWTALKTEIFRAQNQRCISANFLWNTDDSGLNSTDFLWNSDEQSWFLADSEWQFLVHFFSPKFSEVPQFWCA